MKTKLLLVAVAAWALALGACAIKPAALKNPEPADLYETVNSFYAFLLNRDLDSFESRDEMQAHFENQDKFYDFLDTIIPAMWERKFDRQRILGYQVRAIEMDPDQNEAWVKIWIRSDDVFPFGKVMTFSQRWYSNAFIWYPAEIKAKKATLIEKYR